jgi:hypothetical protein
MDTFRAAGVRLYALSYDEPDALADYATAQDVTFTMLSDPDSKVIESFGILNALIPPEDHPWYGIPFPGTFVIDGEGAITHKFFEHNFAVRPGPEQLLAAALDQEFELPADRSATEGAEVGHVEVDVAFAGDFLPMGLTRQIVATFSVPAGQHLYGPPTPDGLVATAIELDDIDGVLSYDVVAPPTAPLTLSGSGETLQAYNGDVVLRLPVTQNARAMHKDDEGRYVTISGRVRWQACDDVKCFLPESSAFSFRVEAGFPVLGDMGAGEGRVPPMNGAAHFQKMIDRRR